MIGFWLALTLFAFSPPGARSTPVLGAGSDQVALTRRAADYCLNAAGTPIELEAEVSWDSAAGMGPIGPDGTDRTTATATWWIVVESPIQGRLRGPVFAAAGSRKWQDRVTGDWHEWYDPARYGVRVAVYYPGSPIARIGVATNTNGVVSDGVLMSWQEFTGAQ
jgi:hypothetical protein